MWKSLNPGDQVAVGEIVRHDPSSAHLSLRTKTYRVMKTEQHYFEVEEKDDSENKEGDPSRHIIKYMDIGYHLGLEIWSDPSVKQHGFWKEGRRESE